MYASGGEVGAALAETHISVVVFVGDRAFKLKKPVRTSFLDYSTRAARRAACVAEVELNRRFAPDVYLGVADVVAPDGEVCDHLVVMRRMPDDRRLATLAAQGADISGSLRAVARHLAAVHAASQRSPAIDATGTADAARRRWEDGFETIRRFTGTAVDARLAGEVERLARRYLAGRAELFQHRIDAGHLRDGHGDLLADDIFCLDDGPRVLDCLDFDERLRWGDVLADVAFLAMDLERLGRPEAACQFLDDYRELSAETWPASLAHHYIAYRAHVRAKVACLRYEQGDESAAADARRLLTVAHRHLKAAQVRLILVGGPPAVGKSTVAAALSDEGLGVVVASDEVRKALAGLSATTPAPSKLDEGLYAAASSAATYAELLGRARVLLGMGESVILDATWSSGSCRVMAKELAQSMAAELIQFECAAPADVAEARAGERIGTVGASDATAEIAAALRERFETWYGATIIDTSGSVRHAVAEAIAAIPDLA